ncbi:hypothetical protein MUP59_06870 [Candidatus Bathyarchaeota archaeon]|jgi:hypothetical protein|nr:hypothetical protein [Candidatus Bathyarchaeota archaeon]
MTDSDFRIGPDVAQRLLDVSDAIGIPVDDLLATCISLGLKDYEISKRKKTLK